MPLSDKGKEKNIREVGRPGREKGEREMEKEE